MKHPEPLQYLEAELAELERRELLRVPPEPIDPRLSSFCSNDYLGLAASPPPLAPAGSGASRLIAGERIEHRELERALASWTGAEDALVFSSGYAANVGILSALASPGDLIVSDQLNHASLIDGARLSKARVAVVPHLDLHAVAAALRTREPGRAWVVFESYYSMDADGPDLAALRAVCDAAGAALIIDEAHAFGVLGPGGRGRCAEAGVRPDVLVGTLGKSFGSQGAFVTGRSALRRWLWNRARSFVFSTGLSPASCAAAARALAHVVEHPELPRKVLGLADRLRARLATGGVDAAGFGHVVPIVVGDPKRAMDVAARVRAAGVAVQAVRPPTVPEGTSRIRLTVTARHDEAAIDRAADAVVNAFRT